MSDDVTNSFLDKTTAQGRNSAVREFEEWMGETSQPRAGIQGAQQPSISPTSVPWGAVQPTPRKQTSDVMGRPEPQSSSVVGTIARNVAEIPGQVLGGVHDAVANATFWAVDPLANWLNENAADLSYDTKDAPIIHDPKTATGGIVRSASQFLSGFIPGLKIMGKLGVTNKVAAPITAGMLADFATRDGHDAKLADLWKQANLPQNVLTDYLASNKKDYEVEGRFKNALEGGGFGVATEGIFMAARALRAARGVKEVKQSEEQYLRGKYGEVTDDHIVNTGLGDSSKAVVSVEKPKTPAKVDLFRGSKNGEAGNFYSPDENVAKMYAGKDGVVTKESVSFSNILQSNTWAEAKAKLGLEKSATMPDLIAAAKKAGYDGLSFKTTNGVEYVKTGLGNTKAGKVPAIEPRALIRGKPRKPAGEVWYHGSPDPSISAFDINKVSTGEGQVRGFFFTKDKESATGYSTYDWRTGDPWPKPGRVYEVQLSGRIASPDEYAEVAKTIAGPNKATDLPNAMIKKGFSGAKMVDGDVVMFKADDIAINAPKSAIQSGDFDVYVNFARFDEPEQVKFVIGKIAEASKGSIDEATRGKITHDETVKLAENLGMTVDDLLSRRQGQGFNAEEAVAARQLWAASGEKLLELAKKAASPDASAIDHFAFRKMMATHAAIQAEVIGARTETARALSAWQIPVKGNIERARMIDQVLSATGGAQTSSEMAKQLAVLAESGAHPSVVGNFAFKGYGSATSDAIKELWVNGLLSSPKTHVINTLSNTIVVFQSIYERGAAAQLNKLVGGGIDGVQPGEATAMAFGLIGGIKDSFRLAAQYLKTGKSQFAFGKIDLVKPDAISPEAFNISRSTGLGRGLDYLGKVVGTPMHMLGAEDEFFKSIGYRMEVRAQALRTASQEGFSGADLVRRTAELIDNPTESMRIAAADNALYQTFTNEMGQFGSTIMHLRNIDHPLNPAILILPFVRTPVNIARYAFERTPFAPLVSQWRADIAAGGARADLAMARMSTGTAIMLTAMDYADIGLITGDGPKEPQQREALLRQGWQPYSVKIGDRWYSYNRADPFGMTVGFAASISEAVKRGEIDEDDVDEWQEVAAMSVAAISQVAISKTYLEGFANFVEVMSDPKRYSESYIKQLTASFLPATSLNAAVKNFVDPVQREAGTPLEAVQARIAGLSDKLPPKRNLWGDEISTASGLGGVYDVLTPITSKPLIDSPIDKEISRIGEGPSRIQKKTSFSGVQANFKKYPKAYDDYVRLAGNELKHPAWQMGAHDYLNAVVGGKHPMSTSYGILSDEGRKAFIQNTIQQYRQLAQQQVLATHPDFAQEIGRLKALQAANRMPVTEE